MVIRHFCIDIMLSLRKVTNILGKIPGKTGRIRKSGKIYLILIGSRRWAGKRRNL